MKKIILKLLFLSSIFNFIGCSTHDVSDTIDNTLAHAAGNKPAKFFHFTKSKYAHKWKFRHKDYEALSPFTKSKDWEKMGGWGGGYYGNSIAFSLYQLPRGKQGDNWITYAFNISTSVLNYSKWDEALYSKDQSFYKKHMPKKIDKYGKTMNINVHFEYHGKENYPCLVWDEQWLNGVRKKIYSCDKYNLGKTMSKRIRIELIYTKSPNLPTKYRSLANEYTYKDLQKRAKRTLDSLYIKDGW